MYEIRPIGRPIEAAQKEEGQHDETEGNDSSRLRTAGGVRVAPEGQGEPGSQGAAGPEVEVAGR